MTTESKGKPNSNRPEDPHWITYVEGACAVLLVFITGFYTYYAAGQLHKMKRATEAAEGANKIAYSALVESNRSWIEILPSKDWVEADNLQKRIAH